MLVQTLYLLADLYWVEHLGKEAIAAVGVAGNLTMIVLALTQMLGVGTTTLMSQAAGRKDQPRAEVVFQKILFLRALRLRNFSESSHCTFTALRTLLCRRRSWFSP